MQETKKFTGRPGNKIFDNNKNYRMYGFDIDKEKFPDIKLTKYGNATICGDIAELEPLFDYEVEAEERYSDRYGYSYYVKSIKPCKDISEANTVGFLCQILTFNQAEALVKVYPDIIDRVVNNKEVDLSQVKGIKDASFEKIKEKIIRNYKLFDYINLFGSAISLTKIQEVYEKYTSIEKIEELLYKDPYEFLTNLGRVGFKRADVILDKLVSEGKLSFDFDIKSSKQRCSSAMMYVIKENENEGHTKMQLRSCYDKVKEISSECLKHFKECCFDEDKFYFDQDNLIIARRRMYDNEKYISDTIKEVLTNKKLKCKEFDIEPYRHTGDFDLSDEQMNFLKMALNESICILTAPGGTGKSAVTGVLVKMLEEHGYHCLLMTPTGRSAKVLEQYANHKAQTIHRALGYNPSLGWNDDEIPEDVVIVDEVSMCSIHLMKHILKCINFDRTKLILIGDNEQLPPVDAGNLLHDFIHSKVIPTATLTKVFRYGSNGLLTVATDIREGRNFLTDDTIVSIGENKDYVFKRCVDEKIVNDALLIYKKLLTDGYNGKVYKPHEIAILSAYNKGEYGSIEINKKIQKLLHNETEEYVEYGDNIYYLDDIIMQIKNDYKCLLYKGDDRTTEEDGVELITNGETGIIKKLNNYKEMGVEFDSVNDKLIKRTRGNVNEMQLGYSYSVHKSQGGSIPAVILLTPKSHTHFLTSNLIYVGITRTTDVCFHLGLQSTVEKAMKRKENFNRLTFTQDFLKNIYH